MTDISVGLGPSKPPITIALNGSHPSFKIETDRIEAKMLAPLEPIMADLLDIVCAVFAADGQVKRGGPTRPNMGEDWRRTFDFDIPVRCVDIWSRPNVVEALTETATFLTDDNYSFKFRRSDSLSEGQGFLDFDPEGSAFKADEVIMFSGGLDSFAGALEALETRNNRVVLVTHRSAQKAIPRQVRLGRYLANRFPGRVLHIQIRATRSGSASSETTQRSRSFLFAALGQVIARMAGAQIVSFYENGVVSQNLPISPQVIGTMATRTTHPLGLRLFNELMAQIGPGAVAIHNPFVWLTKTEVVKRIADHGGQDNIKDSVSCTSIRDQDTLHTHCGACSQCFDRRFAILANGLADYDPEDMYHTEILTGPRETGRSRTMAVDWTRHALSLCDITARSYLSQFGQELLRVIRGHPDMPQSDALERSLALHHRHAAAVISALESAFKQHATALAQGLLPQNCLLRLHAGAGSSDLPTLNFTLESLSRAPSNTLNDADNQRDIVPETDEVLAVTFLVEQDIPIVVVRGIGRYVGANAKVVHVLKSPFDEDRAAGRSTQDHQYLLSGTIATKLAIDKEAVDQRVSRLRKALKQDYSAIFGKSPNGPLLIQSRKASGYRLDPTLRIVAS